VKVYLKCENDRANKEITQGPTARKYTSIKVDITQRIKEIV